jgi:threonine aldolase
MVVGSRDFVDRARRARALLGGGLRQVGVLAAPGLVALRDGPSGMIDRLSDDHANARRLADALAGMPGIVGLDPTCVRTNFVVFRVVAAGRGAAAKRDPSELRARFLDALRERGFLLNEYHHNQVRAVTHYGIDEAHIDRLVVTCRDALTACGAAPASR